MNSDYTIYCRNIVRPQTQRSSDQEATLTVTPQGKKKNPVTTNTVMVMKRTTHQKRKPHLQPLGSQSPNARIRPK